MSAKLLSMSFILMQNIKKIKRKSNLFMHFLKLFTKNSYFQFYTFFTKSVLLLLPFNPPPKHEFLQEPAESASRVVIANLFHHRSTSQP